MTWAYYNEIDPFAAEWLRQLIAHGHIAPGLVDERSIEDVTPDDLKDFTQCHFFAGIGVWSYALRRAGWPDDRPVWTGSCPCQPFSSAGKGAGFTDERHLWPAWHWLISQCRPDAVFGEQVASKDGLTWLDLVQADMEGTGYSGGAVDLCAAGFGAPHIRQRLWLGYTNNAERRPEDNREAAFHGKEGQRIESANRPFECGSVSGVADLQGERWNRGQDTPGPGGRFGAQADRSVSGVGVTKDVRDKERNPGTVGGQKRTFDCKTRQRNGKANRTSSANVYNGQSGPTNGFWRDVDWLGCRDGKWRPVEPGTFPLVNGSPARVGRLRGYGNAINAEVAAAFLKIFV